MKLKFGAKLITRPQYLQFYRKSVSSMVNTMQFDIKGSLAMIEKIKFKTIPLKVVPFLGGEDKQKGMVGHLLAS